MVFLAGCALVTGHAALAQNAVAPQTVAAQPASGSIAAHPDWPKARPDDVKSPEAIIAALSETISGEAGVPRDWNRFRSLFVPGSGGLIVVRSPKAGPADVTVMSVDDYASRPAGSQPFYEKPIAYEVENFGHMTHVYESYGLHHKPDEPPYMRGVNSWELLFDGSRYWVLQVYWDTERPDNPIPAKLLK